MRKRGLLLIIGMLSVVCFADLNIFVDKTRFLDENNNTILNIDYQIPYKELEFRNSDNGFVANLEVNLDIKDEDKVVYEKTFTNRIIVTQYPSTISSDLYSDRISITLSKSGFIIEVLFVDLYSEKDKKWKYEFETLSPKSLISDLEFSTKVVKDTTAFLEKFHRKDFLFYHNSSHIYTLPENDTVYVYSEYQNYNFDKNGKYDLIETILIKKKGITIDKLKRHFIGTESNFSRLERINISDYKTGYYKIIYKLEDKNSPGYLRNIRTDFFSIKKNVNYAQRIFPDLEDEYRLVQYFLSTGEKTRLRSLSDEGKRNFLEYFWIAHDPNPVTKKNEFLEKVRERVNYSNKHYSYFHEGWTTDRGRIYIKKGPPDEIKKLKTSFDTSENPSDFGLVPSYTKYTIKEYQIWIYRLPQDYRYIFIDFQGNGNYRLIYSKNDDDEITLTNWMNYLGPDFDMSLLE
ncbi:MAG: hypothetical protein DRZ79_03400 [Candidatus Cloacimonadota bacterium]|nr:MAG: hypothetical protein DRZ79_03400 [Candidatus Cloacimonadota bacterium]